ncbi:uncharacterized protein EV422DRAFT_514045 [Fimicolochytrium jonesii]|uniref:uncharacterized protein n=1 Tax=Fimicolochytrium jonesii TaxID=1396493 RepID=UPI0022FE504A|nr:uncharacterized protein EV422DRAFT_514045 [Fimicolochytrium jonesii]KAI8825752.1 hypothetical protein EV422DRAFT_514045 [Fimicolochytrium jonesii]
MHSPKALHSIVTQVVDVKGIPAKGDALGSPTVISPLPQYSEVASPLGHRDLDFSRLTFGEMEQLYDEKLADIAKPVSLYETKSLAATSVLPSGLTWSSHPTSFTVRITSLSLAKPRQANNNNIHFRFAFHHEKKKSAAAKYPDGFVGAEWEFECSYHTLVFDALKVDVWESGGGIFGAERCLGRCFVKMAKLEEVTGRVHGIYELQQRNAQSSRKGSAKGQDIGTIGIELRFKGESAGGDDDHTTLSRFPTTPEGYDTLPQDSAHGALVDKWIGHSQQEEEEEYMDSFREAHVQERKLPTGPETKTFAGRARSIISMRSTITAITTMTTTSTNTTASSNKRPESTMAGMKEASQLASALFGTGWRLNKLEIARAWLFLGKYHRERCPNPTTNNVVTAHRQIRVACYFLNYAMAAYGSLMLNFYGRGKGYIRDTLRPKMDSKSARELLGLRKEDLLVWDFETELFKPQFFIARDPKLNALVVTVRGSLNINELIVDVCGDYTSFSHGYAHKGMLRCAEYLERNYLARLKTWVQQYRCSAIYVVGHSMGGGVASLFAMILASHSAELTELSGNSRFRVKGYCFGTPGLVNPELSRDFEEVLETYVLENDLMARLSYGSVCDFRAMVGKVAEVRGMKKLSTQNRMRLLSNYHHQLRESAENPKLLIPGKVFYIYPTPPKPSSKSSKPQPLTTGNPLIDDPAPHYLVERTEPEYFCDFMWKEECVVQHQPQRYWKALRAAHDYLREHEKNIAKLNY